MFMDQYLEIFMKILPGIGVTVSILLTSTCFALLVAFIFGFGRLARFRLIRWICTLYVEVFRGTSLLVQLFWIFFALPAFGIRFSPFLAGTIALGLNYGAYASEIVRGAILAIDKGQTEAAKALNLTGRQTMRYIILPQAFRIMLPAFGNNLIELLKGTSLVSLITIADLTYRGLMVQNTNLSYTLPVFGVLLVLYFLLALPIIFLVRLLEKKAAKGVAKG